MAMAVQRLHKGAQCTIGPWIDRGFYYDFDTKEPILDKDLKKIRKEMQKIVRANLPFIREEVSCPSSRGRGRGFLMCQIPFVFSNIEKPCMLTTWVLSFMFHCTDL